MAAPLPAGPHPSASLYVGDLIPDVTEAQLFEIFNAVGPVASVRVCRDAATRRSLGYAYVNFHRVEDAERALDTMNFKQIRNRQCRIMWSHRDPSLRKSGIGNIFVKNLAPTIDNKTLYDTFSMFGNILSCKVAMNSKRESLGYGFVHYETEESSQNAINRVNGKVIAGQKVSVSRFLSKKERFPGGNSNTVFTNVFLKNLPDNFTKEQLDRLCSKFGEITSSMIASKGEDGKVGRGFGVVNFKNPQEAQIAVEKLNGMTLGDGSEEKKEIFAGRAQKKEEREKELRDRFEQQKRQRQLQYAGVNLYVKNLSDEIDDERLKTEFVKFGQITCARVMSDNQQPPKSRGFGFVAFSSPEAATKAVTEMNGHMLDGKPLYVALAQRKEVRRAQLEAQHAARHSVKMGLAGPQMYPGPGGAPIFYQPMGGLGRQPNYVYPNVGHQMVPRQPFPQVQNQMMVRGQPTGGYSLMPVPGGAVRGGRQGGGGRGAGAAAQGARGGARQGAGGPNKMQGGRGGAQPRAQGGYAGGQRLDQRPQDHADPNEPVALTIQALAAAPEEQKKQMIGERLFPLVQQVQPSLAGKITGMLLEMDNGELIPLLESGDALKEKISEAMAVLEEHAAVS